MKVKRRSQPPQSEITFVMIHFLLQVILANLHIPHTTSCLATQIILPFMQALDDVGVSFHLKRVIAACLNMTLGELTSVTPS